MRSIPEPPAAGISTRRRASGEISVEVCLITGLYGGGARPGQIDERSWLRPPAFKAALRFWWRAAFAHTFASRAEMQRQEGRLFGSPGRFRRDGKVEGGPGLVGVLVVKPTVSAEITSTPFTAEQGSALSVAYFPVPLPREGEEDHQVARAEIPAQKVRARLVVLLDPGIGEDEREQVEEALRLFLVLGGVGARTRRGAGAIAVVSEAEALSRGVPRTLVELQQFLKRFLLPAGSRGAGAEGLWCLAGVRGAWNGRQTVANAEAAQLTLLEMLREVRQDRPHPPDWKRLAGWGQSRWPEADAIRFRTRAQVRPDSAWRHQPKEENAGRYPRAALGLPIIIHFKRGDAGIGRDPFDHTISGFLPEGAGGRRISRLASPLLLRPVRLFANGQPCYVPVAILGPMPLPATVIPVVEPTQKRNPPAVPDSADQVPAYPIAAHADVTENKLIERFRSFNRIV